MAIEKIYLGPNAQTYTPDDIAAELADETYTIAEQAIVAAAITTGEEARDAIVGLADLDRAIVITRPVVGQKKVVALQGHSDGTTEIEQNDTVEA